MLPSPPLLALSLAGFAQTPNPRALIERAASVGFRGILLDAARPGLRPRELDRSARRGLAALLRRLEFRLAGAELWIPPAHFASPEHAERALEATLATIDLLAELAALVPADRALTCTLPAEGADEAIATLAQAAHRAEITLANASPIQRPTVEGAPIGRCFDPSAISRAGGDALPALTESHSPPDAARWPGASRRPGERPDPLAYASALNVVGYRGSVALDLRDSTDPEQEAAPALALWRSADPFAD